MYNIYICFEQVVHARKVVLVSVECLFCETSIVIKL